MSRNSPQSYVNPTRMGRSTSGSGTPGNTDRIGTFRAAAAQPRVGAPAAVSAATTAEQGAKRVEKIRAHSSSHHTAGTVSLGS